MQELPDGSGFFVMTVGKREPGLRNWLKYQPEGCARMWLFKWRMFMSAWKEFHYSPWYSLVLAWRAP